MYDFIYKKPSSLPDALKLLASDPEAKPLAGGMTLIPVLKQRLNKPSMLVDLAGVGLSGITVADGKVRIGAMTTHWTVAHSPEVAKAIPALTALARGIGDKEVRHRGTMGGSVANDDPTADYPSAVVALNATVQTNARTIAADDFFQGMFTTALGPGELITAIEFPVPEKAAYMKFPNPASRYAMVGVFVAKGRTGVRVAVTGAGQGGVFRMKAMEEALAKNFNAAAIASIKPPIEDMNSDIHAGPEYRAHLVGVMARRAVEAAG